MKEISFTKKVIGELVNKEGVDLPFNTTCDVADVNQDGLQDVVICTRKGKMAWFENDGSGPGGGTWKRHIINELDHIEAGSDMFDLTGNGYPDIIAGGDNVIKKLYWVENTDNPEEKWPIHLIYESDYNKFHGVMVGDVTHDGRNSLVFWNQGKASLNWVPLPSDPAVSPWPGIKQIAAGKKVDGLPEEGLAVGDIDGDGKNELVAGTCWYKYKGKENKWESHKFAEDYITTKVEVGDIDGDGQLEIVLSEGDACIYTKPEGGKLAWFKPREDITDLWEEHIVDENLKDPHSLQLGDICKKGRVDIFAGEIGVKERYEEDPPRMLVYENDGKGNFKTHVVDRGTGTHEAKLADMRNQGVLDIIGKPLHGEEKWKVHVWFNDLAEK